MVELLQLPSSMPRSSPPPYVHTTSNNRDKAGDGLSNLTRTASNTQGSSWAKRYPPSTKSLTPTTPTVPELSESPRALMFGERGSGRVCCGWHRAVRRLRMRCCLGASWKVAGGG